MLKTFIKVAVCYPVVFKDEIVSVFRLKMSQLDTEIDKNLKILQFSVLCSFSLKFSTNSGDWNVGKGQQGTYVVLYA